MRHLHPKERVEGQCICLALGCKENPRGSGMARHDGKHFSSLQFNSEERLRHLAFSARRTAGTIDGWLRRSVQWSIFMAARKSRKPSKRTKPYQVFISHATADKWIARVLCEKIEEAGAVTFRDDRDIDGGDDIPDRIRSEIKQSRE